MADADVLTVTQDTHETHETHDTQGEADGADQPAGGGVCMRPYQAGMEVAVEPFAAPEFRPGAALWAPSYGVRFSRPVRIPLSVLICFLPACIVLLNIAQFMLGEGPARASGLMVLILVVPAAPVIWQAMRDLLRPRF